MSARIIAKEQLETSVAESSLTALLFLLNTNQSRNFPVEKSIFTLVTVKSFHNQLQLTKATKSPCQDCQTFASFCHIELLKRQTYIVRQRRANIR